MVAMVVVTVEVEEVVVMAAAHLAAEKAEAWKVVTKVEVVWEASMEASVAEVVRQGGVQVRTECLVQRDPA